MKINKPKGTQDLFGYQAKQYRHIQNICSKIATNFGFEEVITPIFEASETFIRSVGESSDIVNKEMYTFIDKGNRSITLRPEATAAVMRMYVENKLYADQNTHKYFYFGPFFRYERPQAGRTRQFTQFGVEAYGVESPALDADIINMACKMLNALGAKNVKVAINTIGSKLSRDSYREALTEYFRPYLSELCEDCRNRFLKNPLRMLDCKVDSENVIMKNAPKIKDYLVEEDQRYFNDLLKYLDLFAIKYEISDRLVRGLDYYTNDVFEFIYDDATSPINGMALGGGGRYNDMGKEFDGPDVKAIGFAFGVGRVMMIMDEQGINVDNENINQIAIVTLGEKAKVAGLKLLDYLRKLELKAEIDYVNTNLKPQFKMCERINADYIIIIGDDEIANNELNIKNVKTKDETKIKLTELNKYFGIKEVKENVTY